MSKTITVAFKVTPKEKQLLQEAATSMGLSLSAYCGNALLEKCTDEEGAYFNRGNRILSEDDLDDIAGRITLELNSIGEELSDRIAQQIQLQSTIIPEEFPDLPDEDLIGLLDLPEQWEINLRNYVKAAARKFKVDEKRILTIMLAKAYSSLRIANSGLFSDAIGNWNQDDELAEAFSEPKVRSNG